MSKDWYKPTARNFQCNTHPRVPTELIDAVAAHTGISRTNTAHVIDRLHHLSHCLNELESITLLRLQQGTKQTRRNE